jgi:sulfur-oxidizing protein SoxY
MLAVAAAGEKREGCRSQVAGSASYLSEFAAEWGKRNQGNVAGRVMDWWAIKRLAGRREVLIGGGALVASAAALLAGGGLSLALEEEAPLGSPQFDIALKKIIGQSVPLEEGVALDLPEIAENGNIVPYKLSVESPMTEADFVERLHLLSTANPQAAVATFHFTPLSGVAIVTGRMRLAKTQDVVAVAETSTGKLLIGRRNIKVTIGGCGNE